MTMLLLVSLLIGAFATLCIDLWGLFLRRTFGVRSLDYCMLGRWLLHMPGRFAHDHIGNATARPRECGVGWTAHYSIGVALTFAFLLLVPGWIERPAPAPALAFGLMTVIVPFVTLQPAFGLGVAASKVPAPWMARLKSAGTHTVFGVGIYLGGALLRHL